MSAPAGHRDHMPKPAVKCYLNICTDRATFDIHWARYPGLRSIEPLCRAHAVLIREQCPQGGTLIPRT